VAQTKLFLVQYLIEVDVTEWPDFDERKAAEHFRPKLSKEDILLRAEAYLVVRRPDEEGDPLVEEYEDRGLNVCIHQNFDTVGTDVPSYYVTIFNPKVKNPSSSTGDDYPTIEAAKEAARIRVDKRLKRNSSKSLTDQS
jgi:hypothetical protein